MSSTYDEKVLTQLQQVKNMESVMSWLEAKLQARRDETVSLSGENLLRAQGRARELKELLSDIQNSSETLKRARK